MIKKKEDRSLSSMSFEDQRRQDRRSGSTRTEGAARNRLPYKVIGSDRRTDDPTGRES
jgi:hypothetical protein